MFRVAEEGAAKSSAKMLTNFLPLFGDPQAGILSLSLYFHNTVYLPQHSDSLSDITYRKAMQ